MEQHKKVLGIIYIITAVLQILVLSVFSLFWSTLMGFILSDIEPREARIVEFVFTVLRFIPWIIILCISIPSLIAGFGLMNGQKWAVVMALILGCLKILSFPIGTVIGVYSIWVYLETDKLEKAQSK